MNTRGWLKNVTVGMTGMVWMAELTVDFTMDVGRTGGSLE